jgi:hypothetical protein
MLFTGIAWRAFFRKSKKTVQKSKLFELFKPSNEEEMARATTMALLCLFACVLGVAGHHLLVS